MAKTCSYCGAKGERDNEGVLKCPNCGTTLK